MDAGTAITLEEATQKLVDAINKTLPSIPDSELSVERIELPDGGAEYRYHMSEEVQAIFEKRCRFARYDRKRIPEMDRTSES
jgi:hypothetical protein